MARSSFQKLKLLHVMNYLLQNSDEEHPITVNQMIQYLESNGIAAERKSIYDDIEALRTFGMDIEECSGAACSAIMWQAAPLSCRS